MTISLGHEEVVVEAPGPTIVDTEQIFEIVIEPPPFPEAISALPVPTLVDGPPESTGVVVTVAGAPGIGLPGPAGEKGEQGVPGPPGTGGVFYDFNFATPSTIWSIPHNLGTFALQVETFDQTGASIEGYVNWPDANNAEVTFYYPTAGVARVIT